MPTTKPIGNEPERDEDSFRMTQFWKSQIANLEEMESPWYERGDTITARYRDARNKAFEQGQRHLNLLWANTEILYPAIYSQMPKPIIERRFLDRDPIGRMSAQILERSTNFQLEENGFHPSMGRCVKDLLLVGRGQAWVRYEPELGPGVSIPPGANQDMEDSEGDLGPPGERANDTPWPRSEDPKEEKLAETGEQLLSESAPVDYIYWKDFLIFPARARTWAEVIAVGKRLFMSKDECIERFGDEIGSAIAPDTMIEQQGRKIHQLPNPMFDRHDRKRVVYEIWNKLDRKVYWISTGFDHLCDMQDDPLELKEFFPCPEPLFAVMTNDTLTPVPFYCEYQDQAIQIDELTQRIHMIGKCIKVAGTYDGSNRALRRLLDESTENELIPVEAWGRHMERGGVEGSISFLPLRDMTEALQVLTELRSKMLEDHDRITGISDVLRGTLDERETMGGTRLKSNNANTRLDKLRADVARFCRDVVRIVAEIAAKQFTAKTLVSSSGILYEEDITMDDLDAMQSLLQGADNDNNPAPGTMAPQSSAKPVGAPSSQGGTGQGPPVSPPGPAGPPMAAGQAQPQQGPGGNTGQPPMGAPPPPPPGGIAGQPQQPQQPPPPQEPPLLIKLRRIDRAVKLLKQDIPRGFRITIETDSTIAGDIQQEREDAIAFLTAISKFLEQAQLIGGQNPEIVPLLGKLLQFGARKFRTGRDVESAIDDFIDKMDKQAKAVAANPGLRPPSPDMIKQQTEQFKAQAEIDRIKLTANQQAQDDQRQAQIQAANDQRDAQMRQAEIQGNMQLKQLELQIKMKEMQTKAEFEAQKLHLDSQRMAREHQAAEEEHRRNTEFSTHQHRIRMTEFEHQSQEAAADRKANKGKAA